MKRREREQTGLVVALGPDCVQLGQTRGGCLMATTRLPLEPGIAAGGLIEEPGRLGAAIRRALRQQGWKSRDIWAVVGGQGVLVKTVSLPPMPALDRPSAIRAMIEPYVIFGGDDIDVAVDPEAGPSQQHGLLMAAARRTLVLPLAHALDATGLRTMGVETRSLAMWRAVERAWSTSTDSIPADSESGDRGPAPVPTTSPDIAAASTASTDHPSPDFCEVTIGDSVVIEDGVAIEDGEQSDEAITADGPAIECAALDDEDGIVLFFRSGRRILLIHRLDLLTDLPDEDPTPAGALVLALTACVQHLTGQMQQQPVIGRLALLLPYADTVIPRIRELFPAAQIQGPDELAAWIGCKYEDPVAAMLLAGIAAGVATPVERSRDQHTTETTHAFTPFLDLLPGDLPRRRALIEETRVLVGLSAAIWIFMVILSLLLAGHTDREAARAESFRAELGKPMWNLRRIERIEAEVTADLEKLQTLTQVIRQLPTRRAHTVQQLAGCIPAGLEVRNLKLQPDWIELAGHAQSENDVMQLLRALRELEEQGTIGEVELDTMYRDPDGRSRYTDYVVRIQHATAQPSTTTEKNRSGSDDDAG